MIICYNVIGIMSVIRIYWGRFGVRLRRKIMNTKNRKGFTLVELVVVIAIIGVLAAILIPTMMNYVKKARLKAANANAKLIFTTAKSQAAICIGDGEDSETFFTKWEVSELKTKVTGNDYSAKVCHAVADALKDDGEDSGAIALRMDDDGAVGFAQWAPRNDSTAGQIVGQYPNPPKTPSEAQSISFGTQYVPE